MEQPNYFIESDHPRYLEIKQLGILPAQKLETLSYLFRFHPCTMHELIHFHIKNERPDLDANELMSFNKQGNELKECGTVQVVELRSCLYSGKVSQALAPTFELPCPKGMKVFAEAYVVSKDAIETQLSTVVFGTKREDIKPLAIKYCHHKVPAALKRFKSEVEFMLKLQGHKEIVEILHYDVDHQPPYFVMPLAPEGNLASLRPQLKDNFKLQEKVFNNLLDCIEVLHGKRILHRDIKPENFLVFSQDDIKVIDFGISREPEADNLTRVTVTGIPGGTEQFAPPEYYEPSGFKEADATWDTFSLGATMYNLISGRNARVFRNSGDIPDAIYAVLKKSMSMLQEDRYQTIAELRADLNFAYDMVNYSGTASMVDSGSSSQILSEIVSA